MTDRRTALVTGGTGGIGKVIAASLIEAGYLVLVHGRTPERASAICAEIDPEGGSTHPVAAILSEDDGRETFAGHLLDEYRCIDVLINNAGGGGEHESWWDTTYGKWMYSYELNVMGAVSLIRRLAPGMIDNNWGRIVNIASVAGVKPLAAGPEYAACKAALISLTQSLAKELAGSGVTANSISPGLVMTAAVRGYLLRESGLEAGASDAELDRYASESVFPSLTGNLTRPENIADTVMLLLSAGGSAVNGQNIVIDGGYTVI